MLSLKFLKALWNMITSELNSLMVGAGTDTMHSDVIKALNVHDWWILSSKMFLSHEQNFTALTSTECTLNVTSRHLLDWPTDCLPAQIPKHKYEIDVTSCAISLCKKNSQVKSSLKQNFNLISM